MNTIRGVGKGLAGFALALMIAVPADGQAAARPQTDLALFEAFLGVWDPAEPLPEDSPRAAYHEFSYEWGPNQGTVMLTQGEHRTDPQRSAVPGFFYWHPTTGQIHYSGYNTMAKIPFEGYIEELSEDTYTLRYTVHYAEGALDVTDDFKGQTTREFRELHRLVDDRTMEATTFVRVGDGWRRFPDATETAPRILKRVGDR